MRAADLLCHPCDYEGLGKIILESMMLGLPVLVSDVPPLDAYVLEGETGFRVANTPEAWAEKLVALAADKARLPGVSARARAFVEANYDVGRNIDLYEAQFESLLSVAATEIRGRGSVVAVVLAHVAALVQHDAEHVGVLGRDPARTCRPRRAGCCSAAATSSTQSRCGRKAITSSLISIGGRS